MKHKTSAKSQRMIDLFNILKLGIQKTTAEIQSVTKSTAVHSDIDDLRNNGFTINCNYLRTENKRRVYGYQMLVNN